mgnify:CR=1 FL=1
MLTGQEGYETIEMKCDSEVRNPSFAFTLLSKIVSDVITDKIQNIRILTSRLGVVFDLPEKEAQSLMDAYSGA